MQRSLLIVGVAAALMVAWSIGRVQGQQDEANKSSLLPPIRRSSMK